MIIYRFGKVKSFGKVNDRHSHTHSDCSRANGVTEKQTTNYNSIHSIQSLQLYIGRHHILWIYSYEQSARKSAWHKWPCDRPILLSFWLQSNRLLWSNKKCALTYIYVRVIFRLLREFVYMDMKILQNFA